MKNKQVEFRKYIYYTYTKCSGVCGGGGKPDPIPLSQTCNPKAVLVYLSSCAVTAM